MASTTTQSRYILGTRVQAWSSQRRQETENRLADLRERAGTLARERPDLMGSIERLHQQEASIERDLRKHTPCPRCAGAIPNKKYHGEYSGALSRLDNSTEICSECGTLEAMFNFQNPGKALPGFDEPLLGGLL